MFCSKCGKKLADDARFCDGCGSPVGGLVEQPKEEINTLSCPACGLPISYDDVVCPGCGREIYGRKSSGAINKLFDDVSKETNETRKIELIKTFPIPNTREDIIEFMLLASTNFDTKYYLSHKNVENVSEAWLVKIDQCYKKGLLMFDHPSDRATIERIYNDVHAQLNKTKKTKLILLITGIVTIVIGAVGMIGFSRLPETNAARMPLFIAAIVILIVGIILTVFGAKKKKTKDEIREEQEAKERARAAKRK